MQALDKNSHTINYVLSNKQTNTQIVNKRQEDGQEDNTKLQINYKPPLCDKLIHCTTVNVNPSCLIHN